MSTLKISVAWKNRPHIHVFVSSSPEGLNWRLFFSHGKLKSQTCPLKALSTASFSTSVMLTKSLTAPFGRGLWPHRSLISM